MARSDPQVNIRMPQELKTRLEGVLGETGRSLNAEIVGRLDRSFKPGTDDEAVRMLIRIGALAADSERYLHNARNDLVQLATIFLAVIPHIPSKVLERDAKLKNDVEQWTEKAKGYSEYFDDLTIEERGKMEKSVDVLKALSDTFKSLKLRDDSGLLFEKEGKQDSGRPDRPHED